MNYVNYDADDYLYDEYESQDLESGETTNLLTSDEAGFEVFELI